MAPSNILVPLFKIIFFFFALVSSSTSSPNNTLEGGFIAQLIPPLSPKSPFYTQVLKANNISLSSTNVILNRTHYIEWRTQLSSRFASRSRVSRLRVYNDSKYAEIHYDGEARDLVMDFTIGTPLQRVYGFFDTGSELIWFPCNERPQENEEYPKYKPSASSTRQPILCSDGAKCDTTVDEIQCKHELHDHCGFESEYGDRSFAKGDMFTDVGVTSVATERVPNLMFGCSTNNTDWLPGMIGAGVGKYSLPFQLYPTNPKFSYCISNNPLITNFVQFGASTHLTGKSTSIFKNKNFPFYYLNVRGIKVNGRKIDIPDWEFEMTEDGSGGFIIDSGAVSSRLSAKAFDALRFELGRILGAPVRYSGYDICYPPSRFGKKKVKTKPTITILFPEFEFVLSNAGTWEKMNRGKLLCLLILKAEGPLSQLGYEQLYDVNVGYDPNNSKLYLQRTKCGPN